MVESVWAEAEKFLSTSSMKGVPRAFSSETWCLRAFWTVAVLGLLSLTSYQSVMLVTSYLEYSAVTTTYEQSVHPAEFLLTLPIMTLCSKAPVRSSATFQNDTLTPKQYFALVDEKVRCRDGEICSEKDNVTFARVRESLKTPQGYFHNIGYEKSVSVGHRKEDFFANCNLLVMVGTEIYHVPCGENIHIKTYFVQDYFNCFDLSTQQDSVPELGVVLGVELILYLDNHWLSPYSTLFNGERLSTGATVMMSEHGATGAGMMPLQGVTLTPGNNIKFSVNPVWRQRQKQPYGECMDYTKENRISKSHCFGNCFSFVVNHECNCSEPKTPYSSNDPATTLPLCLTLNLTREQIVRNVQCRDTTRKQSLVYCMDTCPMACQEVQYQLEVQKTTWPMPSEYASFYDSVVRDKSYATSFAVLQDVLTENCTSPVHCEQQLNQAAHVIHANFVQVSYMLKDQHFLLFKDVKKVTPSELMSQLGGALNLWSGITVVVMLEVVELLYRVICRVFSSNFDSGLASARIRADEERSAVPLRDNFHCSNCRGFYEL